MGSLLVALTLCITVVLSIIHVRMPTQFDHFLPFVMTGVGMQVGGKGFGSLDWGVGDGHVEARQPPASAAAQAAAGDEPPTLQFPTISTPSPPARSDLRRRRRANPVEGNESSTVKGCLFPAASAQRGKEKAD
jgi:hypothetical protein